MSQINPNTKTGGAIGRNKELAPLFVPFAVAVFTGCLLASTIYAEAASLVIVLERVADFPPLDSPAKRWATSFISVILPSLCCASVLIGAIAWDKTKVYVSLVFLSFVLVLVAVRSFQIELPYVFGSGDVGLSMFFYGAVTMFETAILNAFFLTYLMACLNRVTSSFKVES